MTTQEAVTQASSRIERRDAETLLLHVVQRDRAWLRAHPEAELEPGQLAAFLEVVSRRVQHWPLQYLTAQQEFFGLRLELSPDVLIPRPETELLVEAVLGWVACSNAVHSDGKLRIADVGTGSGAIAFALAGALPLAEIVAVDISPAVRGVVALNAERLGMADRVHFAESDVLDVFAQEFGKGFRFDIVVSNPPYVPQADAATLQPEVRDFEPHLALFGGEDGLEIYRRLIPQAWDALRPGGLLAMELGFGQREALRAMLAGWGAVVFLEDYAGIPRVVLAERGTASPS